MRVQILTHNRYSCNQEICVLMSGYVIILVILLGEMISVVTYACVEILLTISHPHTQVSLRIPLEIYLKTRPQEMLI